MTAAGDGISQKAVSDLENARVQLVDMAVSRVVALARALNWTLADLQTATGVDLGITSAAPMSELEPNPVYTLQALASVNPAPAGLDLTPHPGPHPAHWIEVVMEGDEMADRIRDGESMYVNTDAVTPIDRYNFVIEVAGRVHVRRYAFLPSGPAWTAHNPAYALNFIPATSDVRIIGHVYRNVGIRENHALSN